AQTCRVWYVCGEPSTTCTNRPQRSGALATRADIKKRGLRHPSKAHGTNTVPWLRSHRWSRRGARRLTRVAGFSRASKQDEVKEDGGCEDSCGSRHRPTLVVLPPRQAGPHAKPMDGDVGPEDVHPDGENQDQKRRVDNAVALAPGLVERADSLAA